MVLPPDEIMKGHIAHDDSIALWIGALLGLAALLGGLQNLIGVILGKGKPEKPGGVPKFDTGTAFVGTAVGALFVWITLIYGRPEKKQASIEQQRQELREDLLTEPSALPPELFLAYVRVGAISLNEDFGNGTALSGYVFVGNLRGVRMLIEAGASPQKQDSQGSPLLTAIGNDDAEMVNLLLAAHADPNQAADNLPIFNAVDPETANTPVWATVPEVGSHEGDPVKARPESLRDYTADREAIVAALIAAGARLDVRDERSYTPLMVAAASGQCNLVAPLVLGHADLTACANTGETAQDWAVSEHHPECLPLLRSGPGSQAAAASLAASLDAHRQTEPPIARNRAIHALDELRARKAANVAEAAAQNKAMHPFGWFGDLVGNYLQALVLTFLLSALVYCFHRVSSFVRGDRRPVRWRWIPVFVGSSSSGGGGESSEASEHVSGEGGKSGGAGAGGSF